MTKDDRVNLEAKMCVAFDKLKAMPEYGGRYNSLTPGHKDFVDDAGYKKLVEEHLMFKDMAADTCRCTHTHRILLSTCVCTSFGKARPGSVFFALNKNANQCTVCINGSNRKRSRAYSVP